MSGFLILEAMHELVGGHGAGEAADVGYVSGLSNVFLGPLTCIRTGGGEPVLFTIIPKSKWAALLSLP